MALKAITGYMENFSALNGEGELVLKWLGQEVERQRFDKDNKEAIEFHIHRDKFDQAGETVTLDLSLENYKGPEAFKVSYSFNLDFYDTAPPSPSSSTPITLSVTP